MTLAFSLDRTVDIRARRATVFRFFTDTARFARWWGAGSAIDPVVGGKVLIRYPDGTTASGAIEELVADERVVFTFGYDAPGKPIPPGGSRVTITLTDIPDGTRVALRHDVADATARDAHVQGWRYALALFAAVVATDEHAAAGDAIATWFAAWTAPERARELLAPIVTPTVTFRDANGYTTGLDELVGHIAACAQFMPGVKLEPRGAVRHAHGTALVDWAAVVNGSAVLTGTNVIRLAPGGTIAEVIGIPATAASA